VPSGEGVVDENELGNKFGMQFGDLDMTLVGRGAAKIGEVRSSFGCQLEAKFGPRNSRRKTSSESKN